MQRVSGTFWLQGNGDDGGSLEWTGDGSQLLHTFHH